jgi:hypothetical protein
MLTSKSDISDFDVLKNIYCTMTDVKNWVNEGSGVIIHSSGQCFRVFHNCRALEEKNTPNQLDVKPRKVTLIYVNVPMNKLNPIVKSTILKDCHCILKEKAVWMGGKLPTKIIPTSKYYELKT